MQAEDCFVHFQAVDLDDIEILTDSADGQEVRIQHPWFFVSLRVVHETIRIDNLTVYDAYVRRGIGATVVQALLRFADEQRLVLLATNVLADAVAFWKSQPVGFIADPHSPDDFLPPHHVTRTQNMAIPW